MEDFFEHSKSFRDMVIQCFLNFGEFWWCLPISFQGYEIFIKIFKGIWDTRYPIPVTWYYQINTCFQKNIKGVLNSKISRILMFILCVSSDI